MNTINILLFNGITIIFYFLIILLLIILLKFNWYRITQESTEEKILPRKKLRLLFLFVAILGSTIFFGLYQPKLSFTPLPSVFEIIVNSIIVGGIVYALIYLLMRFLLNHPYTLTGHGKKSVLLLVVLVLPGLFSYQSIAAIQHNDISITTETNKGAVTSDFTKAAFIAYSKNQKTTYLMIENLHTQQKHFNKLCSSSQGCLFWRNIVSVQFYNSSIIIIRTTDGDSNSIYTYNLVSLKLNYKGTFDQYLYSYSLNVQYPANPIVTINSTPYNVLYQQPSSDYIRFNITNCLNNQTNSVLVETPNNIIIPSIANVVISPDFSFLAMYGQSLVGPGQVLFYSLKSPSQGFITNMSFLSSEWNFHFISCTTNTSSICFSWYNATSTEVYQFNTNTGKIAETLQIPNGLLISSFNENESFLLAKFATNYQLYSIKNINKVILIQNESANILQTSSNLKNLLTVDSANNVMLMSYNYSNNTLTKKNILFNEEPNTYQNLSLLELIQSFSLVVFFVALITTIGVLVVDFYFNLD